MLSKRQYEMEPLFYIMRYFSKSYNVMRFGMKLRMYEESCKCSRIFSLFCELNVEHHQHQQQHSSENKCFCKLKPLNIEQMSLSFSLELLHSPFCWIINFVSFRNYLDKLFFRICIPWDVFRSTRAQQKRLEGILQYV